MCNREASGVEQFAQQHQDQLTVIGIGTQDSFPEAKAFRARHNITFSLLWDESFDTWNAFGIESQPAAVLMAANGDVIQGWQGQFPEDDVLRLASSA